MKELTAKYLENKFGDDVYAAREYSQTLLPEYPKSPNRPMLADKTSVAARRYADELEAYETLQAEYKQKLAAWRDADAKVDEVFNAYIKSISGFNNLPEQAREKVWRKAWDDGHSSGYPAIYQELCELVDLF